MGIFSKKKEVAIKDFDDLKSKVNNLELELDKLRSHQISLRGLVNRKLSGLKDEELDEELDPEQRKINKVLLPEK